MPVKVGKKGVRQSLRPTTEWQTIPMSFGKDEPEVATELYYINVSRQ